MSEHRKWTQECDPTDINYRGKLRELARENWIMNQLLVLLDTGRIPADQWSDFALITLVNHNNYLQAELVKYHMTHVAPMILTEYEHVEQVTTTKEG